MQSLVLTTLSWKSNFKINLKNLVQVARLNRTNFTKNISSKFLEMRSTLPICTNWGPCSDYPLRMKEKIYKWDDACVRKTTQQHNALTDLNSLIEKTFDVGCCRQVASIETKRKFTSLCSERLKKTSFFRFEIVTNFISNFQFLRGLETNFWLRDQDHAWTSETKTAKIWSLDLQP